MLTGYNTDFKFQGKIYHCQTEDGGVNSPYITSLLYYQGAILASRKTSYADIVKAEILDEVVREIMMEQHKQMIRDLMQGKINIGNAPHESTYVSSTASKPAPEAPRAAVPAPKPAPEAPKAAVPAPKPAPPVEKPSPPPPPPPPPPKEDVKEKGLDDIILDFLAQEQNDRTKKE
jgi:hypothetical protein